MRVLLFSSVYIAVGAAVLTHGTYGLLGAQAPSWGLTALVFFGTLVVYNLDRLVGSDKEDSLSKTERHTWVYEKKRYLWALVALGGGGAIACARFLEGATLVALFFVGIIAIGYAVPVFMKWSLDGLLHTDRREVRRLKEVPAMKTPAVAVGWAVVTVVLPALEAGLPVLSEQVALTFAERLVFIFALTLPFDIRDLQGDRDYGLRTLAVLLGARRTLAAATGLMVLVVAATVARYVLAGDPTLLAVAATGLLSVIAFSPLWRRVGDPQQLGEFYFTGLLDGMILLQGALLLAMSYH
jgi:hypothetical protein